MRRTSRLLFACLAACSAVTATVPLTSVPMASAAEGSGFKPLVPGRLLDTRAGYATVDGQLAGVGSAPAGSTLTLAVAGRAGVPADASAVVLNVAVTAAMSPGYVTVFPCGSPRPLAASLNYDTDQTISNAVTAKIGDGGAVCLFTYATTDIIVDVNAAYAAETELRPLVPARLIDTRADGQTVDSLFAGTGARTVGSTTALPVLGRGGVPTDASAAVLNVAVTAPTSSGFITVFPCGGPRPLAASLNFDAGQTISNAVTAKIGTGGTVCLYTYSTTDIVVDVTAAHAAGIEFTALVPGRLLDTRPGYRTIDSEFEGIKERSSGSVTQLVVLGRAGVPIDASAVVLNVAVVGAVRRGFVTVFPCGDARPNAAILNYLEGQTIGNAVTAKVGANGRVCVYVSARTQVVVDVNGWFAPSAASPPTTPTSPTLWGDGVGTAHFANVSSVAVAKLSALGPPQSTAYSLTPIGGGEYRVARDATSTYTYTYPEMRIDCYVVGLCAYYGGTDEPTMALRGWSYDTAVLDPQTGGITRPFGTLFTEDGVTIGSRHNEFPGIVRRRRAGCTSSVGWANAESTILAQFDDVFPQPGVPVVPDPSTPLEIITLWAGKVPVVSDVCG